MKYSKTRLNSEKADSNYLMIVCCGSRTEMVVFFFRFRDKKIIFCQFNRLFHVLIKNKPIRL